MGFGYPKKRMFKTDGLCEKWKGMQDTECRGFTKTSLTKLYMGYKNGIIESKSGKVGFALGNSLNCLALGKII